MPIIDVAILTGLIEEFDCLQMIFPPFQELADNNEVWYRTQVASSTGNVYTVVAAFQDEMGPLDAQSLTARVIERWDPAYIILVGIAGSFHESVHLGDVIVSQQVFYYDPGKATPEGIRYRSQGYPCSTVLIRQLEALQLDAKIRGAWQQAAQESAVAKAKQIALTRDVKLSEKQRIARQLRVQEDRRRLRSHRPKIHFGTVASGSLVIADQHKKKELLALHGKIIGTEMEGAGVLHATYRQELPTPAVVVKGISDAADPHKSSVDAAGHWRDLGKENATRLVLELLRRGRIRPLQTDQFTLDPTPGSLNDARSVITEVSSPGVSYLAFPHLVVPEGPLTEVQIEMQVYEKSGPLPINLLRSRYLDRSGSQQIKTHKTSGQEYAQQVELREPLVQTTIGVYAMVLGTPERVVFTAKSPSCEEQAEWIVDSEYLSAEEL